VPFGHPHLRVVEDLHEQPAGDLLRRILLLQILLDRGPRRQVGDQLRRFRGKRLRRRGPIPEVCPRLLGVRIWVIATGYRRTAQTARFRKSREVESFLTVTHPFHPLAGQRLRVLFERRRRA